MNPVQAGVQTIQPGLTAVSPTVQSPSLARFTAPLFLNGFWQGNIHAAGDDALSYLTLKMTGKDSTYQGTWQLEGQDGPLQKGSLSATKQGNTITLKLEKFSGNKAIVLSGTTGATSMTGKVVDTNLVFSFVKS
ncbi:hypothetical protein C7B65_17870 [Phormidesmis priestleyi ULC007]|uniref:Lipocalin-like domain-containing protein n=1 Tax=Phormidesmis priestleyi ULC007 TaxID=1920490 RepID=A0A2T1DB15_9CYAN|nr:hypothetical protein [Phormidesmis priestleyi]PSB17666.1 hypothetical protein C7B65_17870 [Phormidesmis priestleyi ULC007]